MTSDPRDPSAAGAAAQVSGDVAASASAGPGGRSPLPPGDAIPQPNPLQGHPGDPNVELEAERFNAAHEAWCKAYVHVWSDLSRGSFDHAAVEQAADEHWKRSPESDPVQVAVMAFMQPDAPSGSSAPSASPAASPPPGATIPDAGPGAGKPVG